MGRFILITTGFAGVIAAVGLWGCDSSFTSSPTPENAKTSTTTTLDEGDVHHHGHSGHGDHVSHGGHGDMDKMKAGLAKLSEADRASAEKQHICPVTGEMLGTMGQPIKLTVNDHDVWICCDGCRKSIESNPDKYLAKLNK